MTEPVLLKKVLFRVALELGFGEDQAGEIAEKALEECRGVLKQQLSSEEIAALVQEDAQRIFKLLSEAVERTVKKEVM